MALKRSLATTSDKSKISTNKAQKTIANNDEPSEEIKAHWRNLSELSFEEDKSLSTTTDTIFKVFSALNWSVERLSETAEMVGLGKDFFTLHVQSSEFQYLILPKAKKEMLEECISVASLVIPNMRVCSKPAVTIIKGGQTVYRIYMLYEISVTSMFSSVGSNIQRFIGYSKGFLAKRETSINQHYVEFNPGKYEEWVNALKKQGNFVPPAISVDQLIKLINRHIKIIMPSGFTIPEYLTQLASNPGSMAQAGTQASSSSSTSSSTTFLTRQMAQTPHLPEVINQLQTFLDEAKTEQSSLDLERKKIAEERKMIQAERKLLEQEKSHFELDKATLFEQRTILNKFQYTLFDLIKLGVKLNPLLATDIINQLSTATPLNPHSTDPFLQEGELQESTTSMGFRSSFSP